MNIIEKIQAVLLGVSFMVLLGVKKVWGAIAYIPVYMLTYKWAGQPFEREDGYAFPEELKGNNPVTWVRWFFALHYGRSKPYGHTWYYMGYNNCDCPNAGYWARLWGSYMWSGWRNAMYNINYWYFSNNSEITWAEKSYGPADWDHKLRTRKGDDGVQLVWYKTEKGQNRFLWSLAKKPLGLDITMYFGWNADTNGRFTMAGKFKLVDKDSK